MIDDRIILFILMLVLTYVFDHKILPQIGVVAIALFEIYFTVTSTTITQNDALYLILYIINILYTAFMIIVAPEEKEDEYL